MMGRDLWSEKEPEKEPWWGERATIMGEWDSPISLLSVEL